MPTVQASPLALDALVRRVGCAAVVAGGTGAVSAYIRPMITGPVHYEAIISLFIVVPLTLFVLVWSMSTIPWKSVSGHLMVAVLVTCGAFLAGWSLVEPRMGDDITGFMLVYAIVAAIACWLLLVIIQLIRRPLNGPYCPSCSYCLVGTRDDCCPECGRPFTLKELGVTREALLPDEITGGGS